MIIEDDGWKFLLACFASFHSAGALGHHMLYKVFLRPRNYLEAHGTFELSLWLRRVIAHHFNLLITISLRAKTLKLAIRIVWLNRDLLV